MLNLPNQGTIASLMNNNETIFPCPFSKGYGIPAKQAWALLKIFLTYRFVLASLLLILFYNHYGPSLLGTKNQSMYILSSQTYLALSVISGIFILWRQTGYTTQAQLLIFSDIVIITLLMHSCGGVSSGMGILLAVSIASSGLLIGGRCSMLFAAIASLAVLTEQMYTNQANAFEAASFTYAGMLGASFFTIALLSHVLAKRSEQIVLLANQQKLTIANLEELNQYIIQHLQSGIIITNRNQTIQMANEAALRLANLNWLPIKLADISATLASAFNAWLDNSEQNFILLSRPNQDEIHVRFMLLPAKHEFYYMVLLEDVALYNQRLQASKLASLGRLTASIAHEIRNPLSAISHAGELLSENPELSSQDLRLTAIIKNHCQRVNNIIEDILQLSRRNNSRREKLLLKQWLTNYLQNFFAEQTLNPDALILEQTDDTLCGMVDSNHLKQILDNLCLNALKYGHPELGPIRLLTYAYQQAPCIEVIDNGTGISPEHIPQLFEPFFTTSTSGTGLGLYISRELAELNQAKLSYHSTNEQPSFFRLCLLDADQTFIEI
jgi:two-component system sensor histidine kinase PilS (NtrC family)